MKMNINNSVKKATDKKDQLLFIFKVDEQKKLKVVGPFFADFYYDKRRKVVLY